MPTTNPINDILIGTSWSIGITLLLIGWGYLVHTQGTKNSPIWLVGAIGSAIFILLSNILDAMGVATRTNLLLILLIGGFGYLKHINSIKGLPKILKSGDLGDFFLILLGLFFAAIASTNWVFGGNWDDTSGYWPVCHQMAIQGFSEGYLSLRRSLSLGGQYGLQSLGMLFTDEMGGSIYDRGVGAIVLSIFALGLYRKYDKNRFLGFLLGCVAIVLPQYAINSAPAVLVTILLLAAWYKRDNMLLLGLLLGIVITLRTQAVIPAFMIGMYSLYEVYKNRTTKDVIRFAIITPSITIGCLIPGMVISTKLYETALIYLNSGSLHEGYITFESSIAKHIENLYPLFEISMPLIALCGFLIICNIGRVLGVIALVSLLAAYYSMPEYSGYEWARYSWPIVCTALLSALTLLKDKSPSLSYGVIALSATMVSYPASMVKHKIEHSIAAHQGNIKRDYLWEVGLLSQLSIPAKAGVIVINRTPTSLDYSRNKLIIWDSFPAVGNCPKTSDPNEWREWASKFGADYIMYESWDLPGHYDAENDKYLTIEEMWTTKGSVKLDHYERVWTPHRQEKIALLKELREKVPSWEAAGSIILDLKDIKEEDSKNPKTNANKAPQISEE
jgi:hypothetical protein